MSFVLVQLKKIFLIPIAHHALRMENTSVNGAVFKLTSQQWRKSCQLGTLEMLCHYRTITLLMHQKFVPCNQSCHNYIGTYHYHHGVFTA